jgi:uncharacterized SAM-binding protein YcdF (DUF218 family)
MKRFHFKIIQILRVIGFLLKLSGGFFCICILIAFTTLPYQGLHWLGTSLSEIRNKPETIVFLGGSGMPSESNLIRIWFTSRAAFAYPGAKIIVASPGNPEDQKSTPCLIREELEFRGIDPARIELETNGTNTRSQALFTTEMTDPHKPILLITSPENMRRSILTFRKAGFSDVNALPAFENASEADFSFRDEDLGGRTLLVPDVGQNKQLRYQVWNHLKYEIMFAREAIALLYYRIKGWI